MLNIRNRKCCRKRSIYSKSGVTFSCKESDQTSCDKYEPVLDEPYQLIQQLCRSNKKSSNVDCEENIIKNRCDVEADTIGSAVGLTCSNAPIVRPCECVEKELHELTFAQDFATYLKAFALIYVLPEEEWTAENIDKLLVEGEELFQISSEEDQADGPQLHCNIYNSIEQRVKRSFKLEGHNFTVELEPPYLGDVKKPPEQRPPHIIRNLKTVLNGFFRTAHYCLFLYSAGYLMVWRRRKIYFVMDVKGRRRDDLVSAKNGVAMLVCLQTIDNVVHLISNLSGVGQKDKFIVRELAVVRLVTPDGRTFYRDTNQRSVDYNVINNNYAYLKSHLHLSLNPEDALRHRSSLIVCVAAILAAKIDHPASWNTNMFGRLLCYGVELCRSCWGANVKNRLPIDLDKFPTQLRLGQFVVEMKLYPEMCTGQWRCGLRFQGNDFEHEIRQTLEHYGNSLFQINGQMYALWCRDNFYYLLDPYRHTVKGTQTMEDGTVGAKWATVRMFRDLPTMLSVFHQLLRESNRHSMFFIHVVRVRNIGECPQGYALKPTPAHLDCEAKSLNETINFPDELNNCEKYLAEISDYEPDVVSDVDDTFDVEKFKLLDDKDFNDWDTEEDEECECDLEETKVPWTAKPTNSKPIIPKQTPQNATRSTPAPQPVVGSGPTRTTTTSGKNLSASTKSGGKLGSLRKERRSTVEFSKTTTLIPDRRNISAANVTGSISTDYYTGSRSVSRCTSSQIEQLPIKTERHSPCTCHQLKQSQSSGTRNAASQTSYKSAHLPPFATSSDRNTSSTSRPTNYPVFTKYPHNLAVAGSESGTVESLNRLLDSAFRVTDRVLTMTPWGNYVVFRQPATNRNFHNSHCFYLFDGCTCNIDRFRHLDLSNGTAGLLAFQSQSQVVCHMIDSREPRALKMLHSRLDEPCKRFEEFLGRGA